MSQADTKQPKRSILALSLGISLSAFVAVIAVILFSGAKADAGTWVITASGGTYNWTSSTTPWTCTPVPTPCTGAYPGAAGGDVVNLANCCNTVNVTTVIPNVLTSLGINSLGTTVDVQGGGNLTANGGTVANSGTLRISGGTFTNTGNLVVNAGGNLLFNTGLLQNNLANGIVLQGGAATAPGTMTWQGGVFTGPGSMAIQTALSSATLTIDGLSGGGMTLDTQQIVNGGNINFTTALPPLSLNSNAQIINNTLFTLSSDIGIGTVDLTGKIINSPGGTFQKTGGVGTTPINTIFDNNGTVSIAPGLAISFNQGGNHTGSFSGPGATFKFDGSHTFNPGSSFSAGGDVAILAGTFSVNTLLGINGNLSNAGTLLFGPPASTQMLNVGQNYTQAGTGTFSVKLNGTAPGQYDQLNVTGVATLAGTLNATLGYTPSNGDTFFPLTFGSRVSDFGTKILPTYANGAIQASYTASALQLQAVALSADLSGSVSATTNPVNAGGSETWQVGISNSGPDAAASVVVNLSFTGGGTMLTATGPGFTCTINPPASAQCTNPSIAAGTTPTITITSTAPIVTGVWTLNVNENSATADPNPANNNFSGSVVVGPSSDIGVIKTLSGSAIAGGTADYYINIINNGPSDAVNVTVDDTPGPGLTLVSVSGSGCTGFPCTIASLPNGASTMVDASFSVAQNAATVTNSATVSSPAPDSNPANNTSTTTDAVVSKADLTVTKSGPASALPGAKVTYIITVTNKGPSDALGVVLDDPPAPGLTLVAVSGAGCASFPCTLGKMTAGQTATVQASYTISKGATSVTNTAKVTATTPDPDTSNNADAATTKVGSTCPTSAPINPFPPDGATNVPSSGSLGWTNVGAASYKVYLGPAGSGCSTLLGTTTTSSIAYSGLTSGIAYEWRIEAVTPGCSTLSSTCFTFTAGGCPNTPPTLIAPANGSSVRGLVTFSWTAVAGAVDYKVFAGVSPAAPAEVATTTDTTLTTSIDAGQVSWYVVVEFAAPCPPVQSATSSFNACGTSAPIPKLVSEVFTNQTYTFEWTPVSGATKYEVDEARDASFTQGLFTQTVNGTSVQFQHTVSQPTPFFYRVRAFVSCLNAFGPNSQTMRIVLDLIPPPDQPNPNVNVPAGSSRVVVQIVHVPGFPDGTFPFVATVDKPWLQVSPSNGLLPPEGVDLTVTADPTSLPNGTQTGTILVSIGSAAGKVRSNGTTTVSVPVSISLVTPVTPTKPIGEPPPNALIIAAVGHLDGINSRWQSDVSVSNIASSGAQYELTFTPDDPAKGVKQTLITAGAQATVALSDIVRNWYGVGSLGETANGVLEIRPLSGSGKTGSDQVNVSLTTLASSRTYNVTSNGTLGEFIPATPFANFIGRVTDPNKLAPVLGLQQIRQSDKFRTNLGLVEAAGKPVSVLASVFDPSGNKVLDVPLDLKANEQRQLNSFLSQNKIALENGRIEVKVTGGDGKVTAYASVVDNRSGDPYLVAPVALGQTSSDNYTLPGVADVNTGLAAWRTDMTILNSGTVPQLATLTFYPQGSSDTRSTSMTVNPGELKVLDNVLPSFLSTTNAGGAVHVTTPIPSNLVVTGHTYDLTTNGTKGQFIQAVTALDAAGKADRDLQILQVEDSSRYYTNIGIAEVTGKPVMVEVSVVLPDSKISPKAQIPLAANGFFQQDLIQAIGLSNVYNARVSVRVIDGDGKVTAYGSVIDQKTKDATYVPAQ